MLALDWSKAFDSINIECLLIALKRFGMPQKIVDLVAGLYSNRRSHVREGTQLSRERMQLSGISQGCPLSPFIFVMVMSVILSDAVDFLSAGDQYAYRLGELATLLYADDTLLVGVSEHKMQHLLDAVACVGAKYGLELHADKFQLIQARVDMNLHSGDGRPIVSSESMKYLGCVIWSDGRLHSELAKRLGCSWADFQKIVQLWKHTSLTLARKLDAFRAIILSQVLHGLETAWFNVSDKRKRDGFECRCLRVILGIGVESDGLGQSRCIEVLHDAATTPTNIFWQSC